MGPRFADGTTVQPTEGRPRPEAAWMWGLHRAALGSRCRVGTCQAWGGSAFPQMKAFKGTEGPGQESPGKPHVPLAFVHHPGLLGRSRRCPGQGGWCHLEVGRVPGALASGRTGRGRGRLQPSCVLPGLPGRQSRGRPAGLTSPSIQTSPFWAACPLSPGRLCCSRGAWPSPAGATPGPGPAVAAAAPPERPGPVPGRRGRQPRRRRAGPSCTWWP